METGEFTFEYMILVLLIERAALTQLLHNMIEKGKIEPAPFQELIAFLIRSGELDLIHQSSASRAAFKSAMLV